MGLAQWREAAHDLQQAVQQCVDDPEQNRLISEKLEVGVGRCVVCGVWCVVCGVLQRAAQQCVEDRQQNRLIFVRGEGTGGGCG